MDQVLKVFGNLTLNELVPIMAAIIALLVFIIGVGKKLCAFIIKTYSDKKAKTDILNNVIEQLSNYEDHYKETLKYQEQLKSDIDGIKSEINDVRSHQLKTDEKLESIEDRIKDSEQSKFREQLLQAYRYYTRSNPLKKWTALESESFWGMFDSYTYNGGDSYMHSDVEPEMRELEVVEMTDHEAITELMKSRI